MENYIILEHKKFRFRKKMAGFDYDHTIVKPKSKSTFSKNVDDWMLLRENVKDRIQELYKKGYGIVVFTNQSREFKAEQIKLVLDSLEVPYKAYIMYKKELKKPNSFSFEEYNHKKKVDTEKSFYVGDALGRENDWSDSDKKFSENCNLKYYSPEDIFPFKKKKEIELSNIKEQELVLMVGYPGSGKSTYSEKKFKKDNYVILHGDILKTESKIVKGLKSELDKGKSVVIDATNPSRDKRKVFIDIAKERKMYVRVVHVTTSIEEAMDQNQKREHKVPKIVFYVYRKKFEEPLKNEGIDEIIKV